MARSIHIHLFTSGSMWMVYMHDNSTMFCPMIIKCSFEQSCANNLDDSYQNVSENNGWLLYLQPWEIWRDRKIWWPILYNIDMFVIFTSLFSPFVVSKIFPRAGQLMITGYSMHNWQRWTSEGYYTYDSWINQLMRFGLCSYIIGQFQIDVSTILILI